MTFYLRPRKAIGLFLGFSHHHKVQPDGSLSDRWGGAVSAELTNAPWAENDIFLISRLTDQIVDSQEDMRLFLAQHSDVPLTVLLGQWGWDTATPAPVLPPPPPTPIQPFVGNHTRSYVADTGSDTLVLQFGPGLNWQADFKDLVQFENNLTTSIHDLYRAPRELQCRSVFVLPGSKYIQNVQTEFIEGLLRTKTSSGYAGNPRWKAFERLVTTAFRGKKSVELVQLFGGASGAVTALFEVPGEPMVVVKVGSLMSIVQELRGLVSVVTPKLHHFTSRSLLTRNAMNGLLTTYIDPPTSPKVEGETLALTVLTLSALPDAPANQTKTLKDLLGNALKSLDDKDTVPLLTNLTTTMTRMLAALHKGANAKPCGVWQAMGAELPVSVEMKLPPVAKENTNENTSASAAPCAISSPTAKKLVYFRAGDQRGLLAHDALALAAALQGRPTTDPFHLKRMALHQLSSGQPATGKVELVHPRLGLRLRASASSSAASGSCAAAQLAGKAWLKRGSFMDGVFALDPDKSAQDRKALQQRVASRSKPSQSPQATQADALAEGSPPHSVVDLYCYAAPADMSKPGIALAHGLLDVTFPTALGDVHGDMNLGNIVFTSDAAQGWLIDFERSRKGAPIAFDYAKLVVEMLHHQGIPSIADRLELYYKALQPIGSKRASHSLSELYLQHDLLTIFTQICIPLLSYEASAFEHLKHCGSFIGSLTPLGSLLIERPDSKLVKTIKLVADFMATVMGAGMQQLNLAHSGGANNADAPRDMARALAVYCFAAIKHARGHHEATITAVLAGLSQQFSAVALGFDTADYNDAANTDLPNLAKCDAHSSDPGEKIRAALLAHKLGLASFTGSTMATAFVQLTRLCGTPDSGVATPVFEAKADQQFWDVASTGGLANITPIVGYLLLMAKRASLGVGTPQIFVPKISSRGDSGGTVDTLEAGGYRFTDDIDHIKEAVTTAGGLFCKQGNSLSPIDTAMMAERKGLNLMKSAELALASIIGKKIPLGATHVVIDVKLGDDTKMLPRLPQFMPAKASDALAIARQALLINEEGAKQHTDKLSISLADATQLHAHLMGLLGGTPTVTGALPGTAQLALGGAEAAPMSVSVLYTNGDFPLCRAIGRNLILRQLNDMFAGADKLTAQHEDFFFTTLANACNTTAVVHSTQLKAQWLTLLEQMPVAKGVFASPTSSTPGSPVEPQTELGHINNYLNSDLTRALSTAPYELGNTGLLATTIYFDDVLAWKQHSAEVASIKSININPLESLFTQLAKPGKSKKDDSIGFWLHRLPGEAGNWSARTPIISMFCRDVIDTPDARRRLLDYLTHHYVFKLK